MTAANGCRVATVRVLHPTGRKGGLSAAAEAMKNRHWDIAAEECRTILQLEPSNAIAWHLLGITLQERGDLDAAKQHIRRSTMLAPADPVFHNNLGTLLGKQSRHEDAVTSFKKAVRLKPVYHDALVNLGSAFDNLGKYDEALWALCRALQLNPGDARMFTVFSSVLRKTPKAAEAEEAARAAIRSAPASAEAYAALGEALVNLGRLEEAIASHRKAVSLSNGGAEFAVGLATALLCAGEFAEGFGRYERRRELSSRRRNFPGRPWAGEALKGKTILLYGEGGYGNVIQFARYAQLVADLGADVIVECGAALAPLVKSVGGVRRVVVRGERPAGFDCHAPLMSVPHLLGDTAGTVARRVPYLQPGEDRLSHFRKLLSEASGFRVGVCWQGSQKVLHARNRSFAPRHLAPLARVHGVQLVNLQKGPPPPPDVPMLTLAGLDHIRMRFEDVAATMLSLDLVVTCDTSIAHLAGALGVPVWVALSRGSCWRWMQERPDSPWYPSMRLFRQRRMGDWPPVFAEITRALEQRVCARVAARESRSIGVLESVPSS